VKKLLLLLTGMCCIIVSCSPEPDQPQERSSNDMLVVYTVNYPLAWFAQRIGGNVVDVQFPGPPDEDPAYWQPVSETIEQYQKADMILLNGADYAKWITTTSLPMSKCVNTSAAFKEQYIALEDDLTHSHGPAGEHAHGGLAFTTWLDFSLAVQQAQASKDALIKRAPEHAEKFDANYADLEKDLMTLDTEMKSIAEKIAAAPLIVSHPVYQYWAQGYGLNVRSVHWEPDEAPTDAQWRELKKLLLSHPAKLMIWEGEPTAATIDALKALNIESIVFDPCAARPSGINFLASMQDNIDELENKTMRD